MRSCKAASELTSISQDRPLSLGERIALTFHRMICGPCRAYKKQIILIQGQINNVSDEDKAEHITLNEDARRRILENINQKTGGQ
ncbi:MAG: anti-sigma factor family protein [Gammaproteobacteria bacterium]